jgi:hypothetical protein
MNESRGRTIASYAVMFRLGSTGPSALFAGEAALASPLSR